MMPLPISRRTFMQWCLSGVAATSVPLLPVATDALMAVPPPTLSEFTQYYPILHTDDDQGWCGLMQVAFHQRGLNAISTTKTDEAIAWAQTRQWSLIIADMTKPGMDGISFLQMLRAKDIVTPLIFLTARGDAQTVSAADEAGVDDFFTKPLSLNSWQDFYLRIEQLVTQRMHAVINQQPDWRHTPPDETFHYQQRMA